MKELKFEDKINLLEKIVNDLENDNINLDESIEKYTKAMNLIKECDLELKNIEEKIAKIVKDDGSLEEFEIEN